MDEFVKTSDGYFKKTGTSRNPKGGIYTPWAGAEPTNARWMGIDEQQYIIRNSGNFLSQDQAIGGTRKAVNISGGQFGSGMQVWQGANGQIYDSASGGNARADLNAGNIASLGGRVSAGLTYDQQMNDSTTPRLSAPQVDAQGNAIQGSRTEISGTQALAQQQATRDAYNQQTQQNAQNAAAGPSFVGQNQPTNAKGVTGTQTNTGLNPDGTPQTKATQFTLTSGNLATGSIGDDVTNLQNQLNNFFGGKLKVDGKYGINTQLAVKEFQRTHTDASGQPLKVDGIVGPKTTEALNMLDTNKETTGTTPTGTDTTGTNQTIIDYTKFLADKSYDTFYTDLTEKLGLNSLKTSIDDSTKQLQDLKDRKAQEINDINNNPWIPEERRVNKISSLDAKYTSLEKNITDTLTLKQKQYDSAVQETQFMAKMMVDQQQADRTYELDAQKFSADLAEQKYNQQYKDREFDYQVNQDAKDYALKTAESEAQIANIYSQIADRNNPSNPEGTLTGKPQNASQAAANGYAARLAESNVILDQLGEKYRGTLSQFPFPNLLKSGDRQSFEQAEKNFVTAVLRRESGASIAPTEFATARDIYFPKPGDTKSTVEQKAMTRNTVINNFYREANVARPILPGQIIKTAGKKYRVEPNGDMTEIK